MTAASAASIRCETCQDSHQMWHPRLDRYVPCTRCPVPCRECASDDGRDAYCAVVTCSCSCHHWLGANESSVPPPDPPSRETLIALLQRWRVANAEGDDENEALADETDRVIAAEARRPIGDSGPKARHVARIEIDLESYHRGGTTRTATCSCGWRGPARGTLELAADDALLHEKSEFAVQHKTEDVP